MEGAAIENKVTVVVHF